MQQLNITILIMLLFTIMTFSAQAQTKKLTPADVNAIYSKHADHRYQYGSAPQQFADLRLPKGQGPFPVAIIIHGGCWTSTFATLQNTAALADALRDIGIATWNIEYRSIDNGGGWPGTFIDVANAANYIKRIANKYSLDVNKVIIIGHSAGGHLALWLGAKHRLSSKSEIFTPQEIKLKGIIVMGGPPDLAAFREHGIKVCGSDTIAGLLGNSPNQLTQRFKDSSPIEMLPMGTPQILIYGSDDTAVPAIFGEKYVRIAKNHGDSVKLIIVQHAGHHEYNAPSSITWPIVKSSVLELIK